MAVIENHSSDSLANVYSSARNNYYGIPGYPTYFFDGIISVTGGSGSSSLYGTYLPKVNQRNAILSDFTINLTFNNTGNSYQAAATVVNVGGSTASNLVLQAVVTESNLPIPWGLTSVQDFTNRLMVPNQNGTSLSISGGGTQIVPLNFTMEDFWDSDHCELIVFVQNNTTKEILQGTKISLDTPPALTAGFSASNLSPGIGETVNFTDLSTNSPYAWDWSFSPSTVTYVGGTSSSLQNPQVQFNADGYYTVSLTATNIDGSDTEVKLSYIHVQGPTVADFSADNLIPGVGQTVSFTDLSTYAPSGWLWNFTPSTVTYLGGTSSTSQNPQVQFNEVGYYTVSLTATNAYGSDTETKLNYIDVPLYCLAQGNFNFMHISNVQLGTINNSSGQSYYADYTALSTDLTQGQSNAQISVTNGSVFGTEDLGIWIDWNQNGSFNDINDNVVCEINDEGQGTFTFDVPADAAIGTTRMRVRIKYSGSDCGDPCGTAIYGEVEDYSINIIPGVDPPIANFEANNPTSGIGETVYFTDLSTNNPTSWSWSFTPATISYVGFYNPGSQNPQVTFNEAGYYTVELTATNTGGNDIETKIDYIYVSDPSLDLDLTVFLEGPYNNGTMNTNLNSMLPLNQPFNAAPWYYVGPENVAAIPDIDIVDWILIELRDATTASIADGTTALNWQAGFIRNDGKIVDMTGSPILHFESSVISSLYVVIHQRNHLSIMSAFGLIESDGIYSYNFTSGIDQVYGGIDGHKELTTGVWGMLSGDGDRNGLINADDKSTIWENQAGKKGYIYSDYNLDGQSDNKDKDDFWAPNNGLGTQVPN